MGPASPHPELVSSVRAWFAARGLTDAVVGYSGGVDSTLTALLLEAAGVAVTLVVCEAPGQRYASPAGGMAGAEALGLRAVRREIAFMPHVSEDAFHEAALPIQRVAAFYGEAARLRAQGRRAVVVGTTNLSEAAFLGFWGKASDAAQDVYPISGLTKAEVNALADHLGAPKAVLHAEPSGDLLFTDTDDRRMIGASYPQIDRVIAAAEAATGLEEAFAAVENPTLFADNILRNAFKYDLPFPGFHLSTRLETFRIESYPAVLALAREAACTTS